MSRSIPQRSHPRGFTTVELVVVIAVAGILAAFAAARFMDKDSFASRGSYDEAIGVVRYAQKTAVAWRNRVYVCVTVTSVAAAAAAGCATPISHPATGAPLLTTMPSGVSLAPASFCFDGIGRPEDCAGNPSAKITIAVTTTIAGDAARQIVVEAETGYVHQ